MWIFSGIIVTHTKKVYLEISGYYYQSLTKISTKAKNQRTSIIYRENLIQIVTEEISNIIITS